MILNERDIRSGNILEAARFIVTAARTAPKGRGVDIVECAIVSGDDLMKLAEEMRAIGNARSQQFFLRDAKNVEEAQAVVLIGSRKHMQGIECGYCGYDACVDKPDNVPCEINSISIGVAIGSACAMAADLRVDSRVMYSAGTAASRLKFLGEGVAEIYAIVLSASSKSPFFDRKMIPGK